MSHEYCKQHPRPMPRPVMAAIRVRQSRRWLTCRKAYCCHSPRQALRIAVDNSEDKIGQPRLEESPNDTNVREKARVVQTRLTSAIAVVDRLA
jgi:hypothetical protein